MIEAIELTSTRRSRGAAARPVEKVSFDVYPGQVTALLGAPGAGKSTVLRMMVELEPGAGRTLFGGRPYRALRPAVREVGLALNPDAVHPGRTVQAHLQLYSAAGGVPKPRVAEVLEVAGLSTQATVRCGRLNPGQRQRLAIAAALIGDPAALILDEPHALDSHGMSWFHALIRAYAAQGRTVLVAATDPDSLAGTADHVVVLRRDEQDGISRVIASRSAAEVFDERRVTVVQVRSPQAARLAAALEDEGAHLASAGPGALQVRGLDRARIGEVAHVAGICLHELSEICHDDDVFGLRPVPRQKELLPGLNRLDLTWRSGVRLVADEVEEPEVVETVAEEPAMAEQRTVAGIGAQVSQGSRDDATLAQTEQAAALGGVEQVASQAASVEVGGARAARVGAQGSATDGETAQTAGAVSVAAGEVPSQSSMAGPSGTAADVADSDIDGVVSSGAQPDSAAQSAKPSLADSWRSQKSRWPARASVVQPAQRAADEQEPASCAAPTLAEQSSSAEAAAWSSTESVPAKPPAPRHAPHRTTSFGLRWGRGRSLPGTQASASQDATVPVPASQDPASPAPVSPTPAPQVPSAPVAAPSQPAVPFTVAASVGAEPDGARDGMTPWRAVAARASQQKQQVSVAEAAPAEQETSA